jgi:hypothetical protein
MISAVIAPHFWAAVEDCLVNFPSTAALRSCRNGDQSVSAASDGGARCQPCVL